MKALVCLAIGALAPIALAQDAGALPNPSNPPNAATAAQNPAVPYQYKPTEPIGFPNPPDREGPLPEPNPPGANDNQLHILQAGNIIRTGNNVHLTGGAKVQYRGYDITAREITGDMSTEIFDAIGDVHVQGQEAEVTGEHVKVSIPDRTFHAWDANSELQPSLLEGGLLAPLYVTSPDSYGSQREIFGNNSDSTTCNLPDPHFYINSQTSDIRPNTRAIFHHLKLVILGRTVLKLPFLSVPLNQPAYRYTPEVGHTLEDGYYVKTRFGVPLDNPQNNLDTRFDYFQKLGEGIGGDYNYAGKALAGLLSVYGIAGITHTLNISSQHQQTFHWGNVSLNANYQQNNVDSAPGATILNTRLQMTFPQGPSSSRFSFYNADNTSTGFSSKSQTVSVGDTRVFTPNFRTNFDVSDVSNDSGSIQQQQLNVNFTGDDDLKQAIAHFQYQRSIPIGTVQNFFNASDVTPVLSLTTDSQHLLGSKALTNYPFTSDVSLGNYIDAVTNDHITRSAFDFGFQHPDNSLKRAHLSFDGKFDQGVYSDNTAQYTLTFDTTASYSLGPDTGLNVHYNYLRPEGFSPLVMDQTGTTNLVTGDLSFRPFRPFLIGIQSGYDIEALKQQTGLQTPYQSLGVRTDYTPAQWLDIRTLSTYDTTQQLWNSFRLDVSYKPGATFISLGAQYDGQRQVWGSVNAFVDGLKWGRLSISTLLQYNGYTKQFLTQQYSMTYDLHCAEAVLQVLDNNTGFNPGRTVVFFIRLKALPFTSPFGVGSFGQALGTGGGIQF